MDITLLGGVYGRVSGRTVSMTRLDQLAQPTRRNGEHIRAVIERQKQQHHNDSMSVSVSSNFSHSPTATIDTATAKKARSMSRSLTHLAGNTNNNSSSTHKKLHHHRGTTTLRPLTKTDTSKSMTHLVTAKLARTSPRSKARYADQQSDSVSVTGVFIYISKNVILFFKFALYQLFLISKLTHLDIVLCKLWYLLLTLKY